MALLVAGKILVATLLSDVKDMAHDKRRGVVTFANSLSLDAFMLLVQGFALSSAVLTVVSVLTGLLPKAALFCELPSVALAVTLALRREVVFSRHFVTSIEALLLLQLPCAALGRLLT